jgi:hypothetical protein
MQKIVTFFYAITYIVLTIISKTFEFIWVVLRLPVRFAVCKKKGHDWLWLGNGFFGMVAPKKPLKCLKCGKLSTWDDYDKL